MLRGRANLCAGRKSATGVDHAIARGASPYVSEKKGGKQVGKGLVSARLENAWKARLHGRHSKFDAIRSARRHLAISASRAPEITTLTQITIASVVCVPASLL